MNRRTLQIAAIGGLVVAVGTLGGCGNSPKAGPTAETAVDQFFDAASRGDDRAYLRLTSGQLRESLLSARSELGAEAFRSNLRQSAAGIKGLAKIRSNDPSPADATVVLDVELVFTDRNERQRMSLIPKGNGWVITSIQPARVVQPSIPFGTPVFEEPEQKEIRQQDRRTVGR